jgi:hypothetical protein
LLGSLWLDHQRLVNSGCWWSSLFAQTNRRSRGCRFVNHSHRWFGNGSWHHVSHRRPHGKLLLGVGAATLSELYAEDHHQQHQQSDCHRRCNNRAP